MKHKIRIFIYAILMFATLGFSSCVSYLDKEADSTINEEDVFKNFINFQGFIEEIYNCIPDIQKSYWNTAWNWGEDEIMNPSSDSQACNQMDLGNFWCWQAGNMSQASIWLDKSDVSPTSTDKFKHATWPHSWYCIRKANIGLENIELLTEATDEERDLILGQLYFFRAWWHFELMRYFGGLPYIDRVLPSDEPLREPRLSFRECAEKAASDFRMAADYLAIDWDDTTVGRNTLGKNQLRATKITALAYLGKCYLWCASPLIENGAQTGGAMTYAYNEEYAKLAAEALGELLNLVETNQTQYGLLEFEYDDIYNHTRSASATTCYTDNFYTTKQSRLMPGSIEAIFRGPSTDANGSNWNTSKSFGPHIDNLVSGTSSIHLPTANYVALYGMENGLPIDDPDSGFDPEYPFLNRDPRFYHDIIFDGFKYVNASLPSASEHLRYCSLYTGGVMRDTENGSRTGYLTQKFSPHTANAYDLTYTWAGSLHLYLAYMRLSDVYLMYAEACAAAGGASYKASNFSKSALDAVNTIRQRCGAGDVADKFVSDNRLFMDEVRRERAVELAFEGHRFDDLRRWLLITEAPYTIKTAQEFDRVDGNDTYFATNDPRNAKVANFREVELLTRQYTEKHYWLPLKVKDVSMYAEFYQNPGW